jgi:hypothetical protein
MRKAHHASIASVPTLSEIKRASATEANKIHKMDHYIKQVQVIHGQLKRLHKHNLAKIARMLNVKPQVEKKSTRA